MATGTSPVSAPSDETKCHSEKSASASSKIALRLASLDVFRGLVIIVMTYVNYLSEVSDIPGWAKHMPPGIDGFTFVDVVLPAFLFIVGVAIPFALQRRMDRGDSTLGLIGRIAGRSASLLFFGVIYVNKHFYSAEATGMAKPLWFLLTLVSSVLLWCDFVQKLSPRQRRWLWLSKIISAIVLAWMLFIFRGQNGADHVVWLQHSWWDILGKIGWSYLVASLVYLLCRGNSTALMGAIGFMLAIYVGDRHGALKWLEPLRSFMNFGINAGSAAATVTMGMLIGRRLLLRNEKRSSEVPFMLVFGVCLIGAGYLLRPLHGIMKNDGTESYALVTGGICSLLFAMVFWALDEKGWKNGTGWIGVVGQNALLAYMMPGLLTRLFDVAGHVSWLWPLGKTGPAGATGCAIMTAAVTLLVWLITRSGFRLKL
jgi:heparan-alpha-glucosaminide N-acetyltransferase